MHFGDFGRRRREARADRPDGLIGHDGVGRGRAVGDRARELRAHHGVRLAGLALGAGFADTDYGDELRPARGLGLGAHGLVGLAMVLPSFGMADDHGAAARVRNHLGRDVAGVGAESLGVAVLRADGDAGAAARARKARQQRKGRKHHQVDAGLKAALIGPDDAHEFRS